MENNWPLSAKRVLDPEERISAVLSGLIMVLTFTCTFSVVDAGRASTHTMLLAALGCNLAWGIIDAAFYLMTCYSKHGRNIILMRQVQQGSETDGRRIIAGALPPLLVPLLPEGALESMREKVAAMPQAPKDPRLKRKDWIGAAGVALLIFLSTFPVAIPFLFFNAPSELKHALRISNGIAIVMMFLAGHYFGVHASGHPWRAGIWAVLFGGLLVGVAIALGG
jgi:hypothetical protein